MTPRNLAVIAALTAATWALIVALVALIGPRWFIAALIVAYCLIGWRCERLAAREGRAS